MFHPSLSHASPVQNAFPHIDWSDDPVLVSRPEVSLLQSAEDNPLEYTLADKEDAFVYVRVLLKVLDQVTGPSDGNGIVSQLTLDTPILPEDEAIEVYSQDKSGVVAHYIIARLYDIIGIILEDNVTNNHRRRHRNIPNGSNVMTSSSSSSDSTSPTTTSSKRRTRDVVSISFLFYQNHQLLEDWRPLLRILYRSRRSYEGSNGYGGNRWSCHNVGPGEDEFTKRGAALALAYILKVGCEEVAADVARAQRLLKLKGEGVLLPQLYHDHHDGNNDPPSGCEATTPRSDRNRTIAIATSQTGKIIVTDKQSNGTATSSSSSSSPSSSIPQMVEETLQSLISWVTSRLQSSHNTSLGVVTPTLMVLSTSSQARILFDRAGGIGYLARHLKDTIRKGRGKGGIPGTGRKFKDQHQQKRRSGGSNQSQQPPQQQRYSHNDDNNKDRRPSSSFLIRSQEIGDINNPHGIGSSSIVSIVMGAAPPSAAPVGAGGLKHSSNSSSRNGILQSTAVTVAASAMALTTAATGMISPPSPGSVQAQFSLSPSNLGITGIAGTSASSFSGTSSSVQQLYELVFTMWCMTLDCPTNDNIRQHFARDGAIPALAHLLKTAPRQKVLRLAVASLKNLATCNPTGVDTITTSSSSSTTALPSSSSVPTSPRALFVKEMIACGVLKSLELLSQRQWNDPDLVDDLDILHTIILDCYKELTQWKVYLAEVETGVLRWGSLLHTETFFKANAKQMEGPRGDFEPLQRLIYILLRKPPSSGILASRRRTIGNGGRSDGGMLPSLPHTFGCYPEDFFDDDDVHDEELCETLAVCLYDIGEFARHYPNGRAVVNQFGAKEVVMRYIKHPKPEVNQQALRCASKLLVNNWKVRIVSNDFIECQAIPSILFPAQTCSLSDVCAVSILSNCYKNMILESQAIGIANDN